MSHVTEDYTADTIRLLEGVEHVRTRPAMYIGDTGSAGLHHLMYEVVDNSIDEVLAGHATEVWVTLNADNTISVRDNGRGIPADINKQTGLSGRRTGDDQAERGRQVRRRRLQGLRRPARRRPVLRQLPLRVVRGHRRAERQDVQAALRARHPQGQEALKVIGRSDRARHDHHLAGRHGDLRRLYLQARYL